MVFRIFGFHIFILSRKEVDKMAAIYKEMLVALGYAEVVGE